MSKIIIYHGSNQILEKPIYHYDGSNRHNDYGLGFYCTRNLDMAKEWANRKTTEGFANKYFFDERGMKILNLCDKNKYSVLNWIAILLHNREIDDDDRLEFADVLSFLDKNYYIDTSKYDVIIGYRADDAYFRFPLMFIRNVLTYEKLEEIYLLGNLGQQYVLISEKAFSHIEYIKSIPAEPMFHDKFIYRRDIADNSYRELERQERTRKGKRIRDLMVEYNDKNIL